MTCYKKFVYGYTGRPSAGRSDPLAGSGTEVLDQSTVTQRPSDRVEISGAVFLVAMHLFLVANIVTTSKALVPSSVALVPSSVLVTTSKALAPARMTCGSSSGEA